MCRWIRKVTFDCGCHVFNKNHRLFPMACRTARERFHGKDHKNGVKQELFCSMPTHEGSASVKIRVYYRCSYHHKAGIDGRAAKKRAARKPKDYPSVTELAMSGSFDSVFEDNAKKKILGHALGWERGDLLAQPAEKIEMSGGAGPAKEEIITSGKEKAIHGEYGGSKAASKRREEAGSSGGRSHGMKATGPRAEKARPAGKEVGKGDGAGGNGKGKGKEVRESDEESEPASPLGFDIDSASGTDSECDAASRTGDKSPGQWRFPDEPL